MVNSLGDSASDWNKNFLHKIGLGRKKIVRSEEQEQRLRVLAAKAAEYIKTPGPDGPPGVTGTVWGHAQCLQTSFSRCPLLSTRIDETTMRCALNKSPSGVPSCAF